MDQNTFIEQQVQRKVAATTQKLHHEIADLQILLKEQSELLVQQESVLSRLMSQPLYAGIVIDLNTKTDPSKFSIGDEVIVIDKNTKYCDRAGKIVSWDYDPSVTDEAPTRVVVELYDEDKTVIYMETGCEGGPQQIRLKNKDDGTWAVVSVDGKPWKVKGVAELGLSIGSPVEINPETKQIIGPATDYVAGPVCRVVAIHPLGVEVEEKGDRRFIHNPKQFPLESGDRVVVDSSFFIITGKAPKDESKRFALKGEPQVTWDDIGGLEEAKQKIRDGIELPRQSPELFAHYGVKKTKGFLLYGPPGNGKTLTVRAAAGSLARMHGESAVDSGYLYIKSPELLVKWVGETERLIRENFEHGRRHFDKHGYPAVHVYDEADALAPQRGTRRSSDISDTIVPMFLGEMDGADESENERNPIIFLLTNRPDSLDPAVTRPGRISSHIKIDRPNKETTAQILAIHTKKTPFLKEQIRKEAMVIVTEDIFSRNRLLYRVNNEHDFTMGDAVSGAMIASIAEMAKLRALHRDLKSKKKTGVSIDDLREAVQDCFTQQRGINHSYDLQDFAEGLGIQPQNIQVERCFGAA